MALNLRRNAASVLHMPQQPIIVNDVEERWIGAPIAKEKCKDCIHAKPQWFCAMGHPIQWLEDEAWTATNECDEYKRIGAALRRAVQSTEENLSVDAACAAVSSAPTAPAATLTISTPLLPSVQSTRSAPTHKLVPLARPIPLVPLAPLKSLVDLEQSVQPTPLTPRVDVGRSIHANHSSQPTKNGYFVGGIIATPLIPIDS